MTPQCPSPRVETPSSSVATSSHDHGVRGRRALASSGAMWPCSAASSAAAACERACWETPFTCHACAMPCTGHACMHVPCTHAHTMRLL
eukprot:scaffold60351_cov53-Phaeocystis_antarctica.AAC.2